MDTGLLKGALVALAVLLLLTALQALLPDWTWRTAAGLFAPLDTVAAFVSMAAGAAVARTPRFRLVAPLLQLVVAGTTLLVFALGPSTAALDAVHGPGTVLRLNGLPLLLGVVAAWAGAVTGERLRPAPRSTAAAH